MQNVNVKICFCKDFKLIHKKKSYVSLVFRIRIIWPDPDPLLETWIRIWVTKNLDKVAYKSTKIIRKYFLKKSFLSFFV